MDPEHILLSMVKFKVHIPAREVRQLQLAILHQTKIVNSICWIKNRIPALLKSNVFTRPASRGNRWNSANRLWMHSFFRVTSIRAMELWRMSLADMFDELGLLENQLIDVWILNWTLLYKQSQYVIPAPIRDKFCRNGLLCWRGCEGWKSSQELTPIGIIRALPLHHQLYPGVLPLVFWFFRFSV